MHARLLATQPAQARLRVDQGSRERLLQFVRYRGGHFSQHRDAVDMSELRLQLVRALAVLDIGCHSAPLGHLPAVVPQRRGAHLEPTVHPIRPSSPRLIVQRFGRRDRRPPLVEDSGGSGCTAAAIREQRLLDRHRASGGSRMHDGHRHSVTNATAGIDSTISPEFLFLFLEMPDPESVSRPQRQEQHRADGTNWSGRNAAEVKRVPAPVSFQTPLLFAAITRNEYSPGAMFVYRTLRRVPASTQAVSYGSSRYLNRTFSGAARLSAVKRKSRVLCPGGTEDWPLGVSVNVSARASSSMTGGGARSPAMGSMATTPRNVATQSLPSEARMAGLPRLLAASHAFGNAVGDRHDRRTSVEKVVELL